VVKQHLVNFFKRRRFKKGMGIQKLWEILVPQNSNTGAAYSLEHHKAWDEKVRELSGGLTLLRTVKGQWINPDGRTFIDTMIPVRIYCDEMSIDKIIAFTLTHYNQEEILAYEISSNVKLVRRKNN